MRTRYLLALTGIIFFLSSYIVFGQEITPYMGKNRIIRQSSPKVLPTDVQKAYDVKWVFLNLNAENNTVALSGDVTIKAEVTDPVLDTFSFHLQRSYTIDRILINGDEKEFETKEDERLVIDLDLEQGSLFEAQIFYHGAVDQSGDFFSGISSAYDNRYGFDVTWTLSEPNNAYHWFPVKQDLTDKIDSVWVFITTSKPNMAGSNGVLTGVAELPGDKVRYEWKSNYPIDYYLISMAVADYQDYSIYATIPQTGEEVLIQNYIYNSESCLSQHKEAIDETKDMIEYLSELFGPYPFTNEKYGHTMAYMGGAMEHQTMTTTGYLYDGIIMHELAHQWFGDLVTCASWEYIWLNEGFASYSEWIWYEHVYGREVAFEAFYEQIIKQVRTSGRKGSVYVPKEYIDDEDRIFNGTLTYNKGAILVHMLRYELDDDELFYNILQTYLQRFAHGVATADDFKSVLEELSREDFTTFFDQWYYGEGYPTFSIYWDQTGDILNVNSKQTVTASDVTPLFKVRYELKLSYEDGDTEIISFFQEETEQDFMYTISGDKIIKSIKFDPDYWLLASGTVRHRPNAIEDYDINGKIFVYPNPATDYINIRFDDVLLGEKRADLVDVTGKLLHTFRTEDKSYQLDIAALAPGIYFLNFHYEGKTYIQKIIK